MRRIARTAALLAGRSSPSPRCDYVVVPPEASAPVAVTSEGLGGGRRPPSRRPGQGICAST